MSTFWSIWVMALVVYAVQMVAGALSGRNRYV